MYAAMILADAASDAAAATANQSTVAIWVSVVGGVVAVVTAFIANSGRKQSRKANEAVNNVGPGIPNLKERVASLESVVVDAHAKLSDVVVKVDNLHGCMTGLRDSVKDIESNAALSLAELSGQVALIASAIIDRPLHHEPSPSSEATPEAISTDRRTQRTSINGSPRKPAVAKLKTSHGSSKSAKSAK